MLQVCLKLSLVTFSFLLNAEIRLPASYFLSSSPLPEKTVDPDVVWPTFAAHVTGYPSVWLRGDSTMSLCHCCSMSHTLAHTRPLLSWLENSHITSSTIECELHTKDNVTLFKICCGPLSPASPLHYGWHRYVPQTHFVFALSKIGQGMDFKFILSCCTKCAPEVVLFCSRQRLLSDLQWEPQQVHKGGERHLSDRGSLWPSCQRAAVSLGLRITRPQSVPQALSGSHGD